MSTTEIAPLNPSLPAAGSDSLLDDMMAKPFDVESAMQRLELLKRFFSKAMEEGQGKDYGPAFPGSTAKALYTNGADKFCQFIAVYPRPREIHRVEQWGMKDGEKPFFSFEYQVDIVSRRTGQILAVGVGSANSLETKFRYRSAKQACPQCGQSTIMRSKYPDRETGDVGWYCNRNADGCGASFTSDDEAITSQEVGKIENVNIQELHHNINRLAVKRGKVHGVAQLVSAIGILMTPGDDEDEDNHQARGAAKGGAKTSGSGGKSQAAGVEYISDEQLGQIEKAVTANGHQMDHLIAWAVRELQYDAANPLPRKLFISVLKRASDKTPLGPTHDGDPFAGGQAAGAAS